MQTFGEKMNPIASIIAVLLLVGILAGCDEGARSSAVSPQAAISDAKPPCGDPAPLTGSPGEAGALFENYELILKIQTSSKESDRIIKELEERYDRAFSPMMGEGNRVAGWWASLGKEKVAQLRCDPLVAEMRRFHEAHVD